MRYKIKPFDELKDKTEVNQNIAIDLGDIFKNGTVPDDLAPVEEKYNGITEPDAILGRPTDVFEAAHMKETISNYKAPETKENE